MVLHIDRERAIGGGARRSAEPLGDLLLHEHRDALKALRLEQRRDGGRRDVVGQVRADDGRESRELFAHKGWNVGLEDIGGDDLEVIEVRHRLVQNGQQRLVQLDRDDPARTAAELVAERADAGADLQHAVSLPRFARLGDGGGDGGVDEEILPHGLAEMKAVAAQQRLDGGKVTMLHACLLCR